MKILQVQFKNRNGHTLRGIVTLPDTEGKVPFVVHLHGFAGSCSGYKSMYTHLSRALAAQGIGSARFDFYGNGESDGEFEDMSFDGLHTDAQDIFAWAAQQPYVDSEKMFLSGQSMGGYIAASCAPVIQPHGLILLCPGAGMWFGCAQRADGVTQTGKDYADMEVCATRWPLTTRWQSTPTLYEAKGYNGPCCCCAPTMTVWWTRAPAAVTHRCTPHPRWTPLRAVATTLLRWQPVPPWRKSRSIHQSKSVKQSVSARRLFVWKT